MAMQRRDVLKILTATPFLGCFGSTHTAQAKHQRNRQEEHIWRVFEEPFLSEIAFPLGGIGTGTVSLGGRGNLRDWEICNRPHKGRNIENTFFALWIKEENSEPKAYILEPQLKPPFRGGFGLDRGQLPGMPRLQKARFLGSYPFARMELEDDRIPLDISLECFNPFIPNNEKDSGIPAVIFYWQLKNTSKKTVDLSLMASLLNIAGDDSLGKNLNEYRDSDDFRGLYMTTQKHEPDDEKFGNLALITMHDEVTYTTRWNRGGWFDSQSLFWNDFSQDGRLDGVKDSDPSPDNRSDTGSVGALLSLEPGESKTVPFMITWYFPNRHNYWNGEDEVKGKFVGNYYATQFKDAWDVASYTVKNLQRLEEETRVFHDALFSSTLPAEVLDAVSSQASIIRTNTCFRNKKGKFFAFEGCADTRGCCPLNCTHVWNYEQTLAHLFPRMERTMRDTDFNYNTNEKGHMAFRTLIPLGLARWGFRHAAADGQMGTIVKLYREWQLSGDIEFLKSVWDGAKRALEYAWEQWDPDQDGVMTGIQHNTYDIEFHGPNPMMGAIYLTALLAGEKMARAVGDYQSADKYRRIYESGTKKLDQQTWNEEYYIQVFDRALKEKYQLGEGCLSDQLLGQWMSHVVGLGYVLPPDRVKSAIHSVYRYNFKETLSEHYNPQRIFALGDEAGLLLCSWPRGNRPPLPFVYSDEVWTGIEYQVAAHLIYEGYIDEGINIVKGVRNRYDGERRNPWNEVECGHHYARAMASWSVLLALSGFHISVPDQKIAFHPLINERNFSCMWSAGPGWGTYNQIIRQSDLKSDIQLIRGEIKLQQLALPAPNRRGRKETLDVEVFKKQESHQAEGRIENDDVLITLKEAVNLSSGDHLLVHVRV